MRTYQLRIIKIKCITKNWQANQCALTMRSMVGEKKKSEQRAFCSWHKWNLIVRRVQAQKNHEYACVRARNACRNCCQQINASEARHWLKRKYIVTPWNERWKEWIIQARIHTCIKRPPNCDSAADPEIFQFLLLLLVGCWTQNKKYSGIKWCACMLASQPTTTTTKKPTPAKFNIFRIYFINYEKKHNRNQANWIKIYRRVPYKLEWKLKIIDETKCYSCNAVIK